MVPRGASTWIRPLVPECQDSGPTVKVVLTSVIALTGADASAPPAPGRAPVTKVGITVPTLAVRGRERLRPWAARPRNAGRTDA